MSADTPDQPRPRHGPESDSDQHPHPTEPAPRPAEPSVGAARVARSRPVPPRRRGRAPLPVAAAVAAGWAALLSYLPVVAILSVVRFAEDDRGFAHALQLGLASWLLGHGVPLTTSAGPMGLTPLALTLLAGWRVARAGVHVSRAIGARHRGTPGQALAAAGSVGLGYGLIGLLAAILLADGQPVVSPIDAGARLTIFGTLAALVGALPATGVLAGLLDQLPTVLRDATRTGLVAALLVLAAGAGAAGLAVATGGGEASDMLGAYRTGVAGQAGLTLICLGYAPNAAVWAASYLLGPGFAVGTDSVVRITEVSVGALPAVPIFAGLPHGPVEGIGVGLLAVPLIAGMTAGWLLARHARRHTRRERIPLAWSSLLLAALLAGPVAGVTLGVTALVSSGPLGSGRLAEIGPTSWQVAAVGTAVLAIGTLGGAAASHALTLGAPPKRGGRPVTSRAGGRPGQPGSR
jgi:hypothetical protein